MEKQSKTFPPQVSQVSDDLKLRLYQQFHKQLKSQQ